MSQLINIRADANRDGQVGPSEPGQRNWVWGKNQPGAVLLVNNDRDPNELAPTPGSSSELSEVILDPIPSHALGENQTVHLYATENAARRFTVYRLEASNTLERVLGADPTGNAAPIPFSKPLSLNGEKLYVEANQFPDSFFEGLITLEILVVKNNQYTVDFEQIIFRVAPWIMTPNTQRPLKVFTVRLTDSSKNTTNQRFLDDLRNACARANVPLSIIEGADYASSPVRQDRWIQDEIEFGYCQGASHMLPVVFDSPRDRALDHFPERELLGPDFGHFQIDGFGVNSLDSFGNLEVSPPVVVQGREYPFGRIVFGGKKLADYGDENRQMMPNIRKFLYAQKVQSPIEVFSDWLVVGHVDEFLNFIPDSSSKGFKLLLASTSLCVRALEQLSSDGHGEVTMFEGREREYDGSGISAEIKIDEILADSGFLDFNEICQKNIDINRSILVRELELQDSDIIEAPVLFKENRGRAFAFFPDMVNHLVLEGYSLVPKPYGPVIDGEDYFEKMMRDALPSSRTVIFIEDWYAYHEMLGEVHCGTNTRRQPFRNKSWWDYLPDGGFNI